MSQVMLKQRGHSHDGKHVNDTGKKKQNKTKQFYGYKVLCHVDKNSIKL